MKTPKPRVCRRASELISLAMDRPLTRRERCEVLLHVPLCGACRLYRRQLVMLRQMTGLLAMPSETPEAGESGLTEEARRRIAAALDQRLRASAE